LLGGGAETAIDPLPRQQGRHCPSHYGMRLGVTQCEQRFQSVKEIRVLPGSVGLLVSRDESGELGQQLAVWR
jgi:hypothetical protein